jgi:PAS domain S-box-containing protein
MVSISFPDFPSDAFLFEALMENTADSIYFKDRQCRLLRVSCKMAESLGFSDPSELIGKTDIDLYGESFGKGTRLDDLGVMESDRPIIGLIESRKLDNGQTNWTLSTKLPLHDRAGTVVGLVGITREINEMRETEVALQHIARYPDRSAQSLPDYRPVEAAPGPCQTNGFDLCSHVHGHRPLQGRQRLLRP